jgi:hypothetical protein
MKTLFELCWAWGGVSAPSSVGAAGVAVASVNWVLRRLPSSLADLLAGKAESSILGEQVPFFKHYI